MEPVRTSASLPQVVEPETSEARAEMEPKASVKSGASSKPTSSSADKVFQPSTGDEVLIAFEHGDQRMPFLMGGLWTGDAPPTSASPPADAGGTGGTQSTGAAQNAAGHNETSLKDEVIAHHLRNLK